MLPSPLSLRASFALTCLGLGLGLTLPGCGDAVGPGGKLGQSDDPLSGELTPFLFTNDCAAFSYFVGRGLPSFQAAGIVGNLDQESGVDPSAVQAGGPGRGIAQWSVGGRWDTDGNDNAVWYAGKQGASVYSLQLQLEFIWYELTTFSGYGLGALKASTNVTAATVAFQNDFEGCGTCDQSTRIAYAQTVLAQCGAVPYGAQWVSQTFPLASTTLTMVEGQVLPGNIVLKNTGTKSWDSSTRIGTTQPRDRTSPFASSGWVSASRPAEVKGTVPPGGTYTFSFDLTAPSTPGLHSEFFGVVQEGVAWFSDPGQGGPPDNDLEVKINVVPPDYRGAFKDQSFPLSPKAVTVSVGDVATGYVELTNTGAQPWKAGTTKLAPIPRDKPSPFADTSWLSTTRISTVKADVAPGAVGRFDVAFDGKAIGDSEIELGLVEEGVTWFADALKGGGPPDGFLKVHLVVVAKGAATDGGVGEGGTPGEDAGAAAGEDGGSAAPAGDVDAGEDASSGSAATAGASGGCSVGPTPGTGAPFTAMLGLLMAGAARARRSLRPQRSRR